MEPVQIILHSLRGRRKEGGSLKKKREKKKKAQTQSQLLNRAESLSTDCQKLKKTDTPEPNQRAKTVLFMFAVKKSSVSVKPLEKTT